MEAFGIYLALIGTTALCAWGTHAAWRRGHRRVVWVALALVVAAVALCAYLSSVATGSYLAGLVEALIAMALMIGPGAGILLGLVTANWNRIGLALFGVYALGLGVALADIL